MHTRLYELELWRARKDVIDDERHIQNTAAIRQVADASVANGTKLDTLLLRTAGEDGSAKTWGSIGKGVGFLLTLIFGGGIADLIWRKH